MTDPAQFHGLSPGLALWQTFDRAVKTDLFSSALSSTEGTVLIDPIALNIPELAPFQQTSPIRAIVVTNQNHWRGAAALAQALSVPIFAHRDAALIETRCEFSEVNDGDQIATGLQVIAIPGAAPGEIAVLSPADKGTLVVGDGLINFEPYGFTFLPAKYCVDQKRMRKSLRRLLDHPFETILFAHGFPILSRASERLRSLLEQT